MCAPLDGSFVVPYSDLVRQHRYGHIAPLQLQQSGSDGSLEGASVVPDPGSAACTQPASSACPSAIVTPSPAAPQSFDAGALSQLTPQRSGGPLKAGGATAAAVAGIDEEDGGSSPLSNPTVPTHQTTTPRPKENKDLKSMRARTFQEEQQAPTTSSSHAPRLLSLSQCLSVFLQNRRQVFL